MNLVTAEHVKWAEDTCGKDVSCLKGKTTRSSPKPIKSDEIVMPQDIFKKHGDITFHMDTMHVDGLPFFTSIVVTFFDGLVSIQLFLFLPLELSCVSSAPFIGGGI